MKVLTRAIWTLSLVSLFTDMASEMLYPIMPIYLKSIGFSVLLIGILEGFAEAIAGLSKGFFGNWSDNINKRVPFVRIGYALSALSKPMLAMFVHPLWVFTARTMDRFGKGIRTGARDALLSSEASPETKGRVFGFHRSMDTFGAVLGPIFALAYLVIYPENYKALFFIAFIPGFLSILTTLFLKEKTVQVIKSKGRLSPLSFLSYWKKSPRDYRKLVIGLLLFALFNSSDVFLLLKAKQTGLGDELIIGAYIFYNLIFALFAYPLGILADKIGLRKMFIIGLVLFAAVYLGMAMFNNFYALVVVFFIYGLFAAATEGVSKAWISNTVKDKDTASAIGLYSGFQSICSLLASSLAGFIWFQFGPNAIFYMTFGFTLVVIIYFNVIELSRGKISAD